MRESHVDHLLVQIGEIGETQPPSAEARERGRIALLREIAGEQPMRRSAPRRRATGRLRVSRRLALAMGVPLVVLSLGAAGYAALSSSPSRLSDGVDCHLDHRLSGSGTILGLDGRPATAICADAWRRGAVEDRTHAAPPLQACVDPAARGAIHVFASADSHVCARLGLRADPAAGSGRVEEQFASLSRDLQARFASAGCVSATTARQLTHDELERRGLQNSWRIVVGTSDAAKPCMSLAFDSDAHIIRLLPVPHE